MTRLRTLWAPLALVIVLTAGAALYATGRLVVHWQPAPRAGSADGHGHADGAGHDEDGEHDDGHVKGDMAVLDAEAIRAAGIRTAPAAPGSIATVLDLTGEVQAPDDRIAYVTPRLAGVVREILHRRGDRVARGVPLATLESVDLGEARAAYAQARTDLVLAERNVAYWRQQREDSFALATDSQPAVGWVELDQAVGERAAARAERTVAERNQARLLELARAGLRSRTEVLGAEAEVTRATVREEAARRRLQVLGATAETEVARARQRLAGATSRQHALGAGQDELERLDREGAQAVSSRFVVRSPIAGVIEAVDLTLGEVVDPARRIFTLVDLGAVWVRAAVYDRDVAAIRQGMPAAVRAQGLDGVALAGRVIQIGPAVDEKTRTLPVRVEVKNSPASGRPDGLMLRPGMFVTVGLEVGRRAGGVVVPLTAVQFLEGRSVVFVETPLTDGASFVRRAVRLGARDGNAVEVTEGVKAGDRVVVAGAFLLKSEFERAKIGGGHGH